MRSEIKCYEPTWGMLFAYHYDRFLDFIARTRFATKPHGPWCLKCGTDWPDLLSIYQCPKCGVVDGPTKKRYLDECRQKMNELLGTPHRKPANTDTKRREGFRFSHEEMVTFASMGPMGGILAMSMILVSAKRRSGWWKVFDLKKAPATKVLARVAYLDALKNAHPDQGGNEEAFNKVRSAWGKAERYYAKREVSQAADQV